jgi:hypothetical protein
VAAAAQLQVQAVQGALAVVVLAEHQQLTAVLEQQILAVAAAALAHQVLMVLSVAMVVLEL